jgi:hypothetical protein
MNAVDYAHGQLAHAFAEPDLAGELHSTAFWHIHSIGTMGLLDLTVIHREVKRQLSSLENAKLTLAHLKALAQLPGMPVVYDTNMLNHWVQPSDVRWRQVFSTQGVKVPLVRLVVPMTVIDELDRQKYGKGDLAQKAATAIRYLNRTLNDRDNHLPVEIRNGEATLEVWHDPEARRRDTDPDMEILLPQQHVGGRGMPARSGGVRRLARHRKPPGQPPGRSRLAEQHRPPPRPAAGRLVALPHPGFAPKWGLPQLVDSLQIAGRTAGKGFSSSERLGDELQGRRGLFVPTLWSDERCEGLVGTWRVAGSARGVRMPSAWVNTTRHETELRIAHDQEKQHLTAPRSTRRHDCFRTRNA